MKLHYTVSPNAICLKSGAWFFKYSQQNYIYIVYCKINVQIIMLKETRLWVSPTPCVSRYSTLKYWTSSKYMPCFIVLFNINIRKISACFSTQYTNVCRRYCSLTRFVVPEEVLSYSHWAAEASLKSFKRWAQILDYSCYLFVFPYHIAERILRLSGKQTTTI